MKLEDKKRMAAKAFAAFFIFMAAAGGLSRAAAAMTVPLADTGTYQEGRLNLNLTGTAVAEAKEETLVFLDKDQRILSVAKTGTQVEAGEVLLQYDHEQLHVLPHGKFCQRILLAHACVRGVGGGAVIRAYGTYMHVSAGPMSRKADQVTAIATSAHELFVLTVFSIISLTVVPLEDAPWAFRKVVLDVRPVKRVRSHLEVSHPMAIKYLIVQGGVTATTCWLLGGTMNHLPMCPAAAACGRLCALVSPSCYLLSIARARCDLVSSISTPQAPSADLEPRFVNACADRL